METAKKAEEGQRFLVIVLAAGQECPPQDDPRIQAAIKASKSAFVVVNLGRVASTGQNTRLEAQRPAVVAPGNIYPQLPEIARRASECE